MNALRHGRLTAAALLLAAGCTGLARKPAVEPASEADHASAIAAFRSVHSVAINTRCTNCHAPGERPLQLDGSRRRFHAMNVQRRIVELGHHCATCHQDRNFDQPHLPPGAPHWNMPSAPKAFDAGITANGLCRLWLDPERNVFELGPRKGEARTPADLLEHIATDPLVRWTWDPGPGRMPSPGTHAEFLAHFSTWVAGGAPCPPEETP
jgi:hypothetical protein